MSTMIRSVLTLSVIRGISKLALIKDVSEIGKSELDN